MDELEISFYLYHFMILNCEFINNIFHLDFESGVLFAEDLALVECGHSHVKWAGRMQAELKNR